MRLLINMYLLPVGLLVAAFLLVATGYRLEDAKYFAVYAVYLTTLGKAFAAGAFFLAIANAWKVWRAYQGKGELCHQCGYPVKHIPDGRYGPYFKCWSCGANRAERS